MRKEPLRGPGNVVRRNIYNIEAEALGQKVVSHPRGIPDVDRTRPLISNPADLDRIAPPDPRKSARMPWVLL